MPYNFKDFYDAIDKLAAFSTAAGWDNSGLLIGLPGTRVKSALFALDVTLPVISEARLLGANLIITHHPVIFPSVKSIDGDGLLYGLIRENIGVISAHTNLDTAQGGVNDTLCGLMGLKNTGIMENPDLPGLGRLGELERPMNPDELAAFVREKLNAGGVQYTRGGRISVLAVCGGSGGELWRTAAAQNAQALVTSEVKHHHMLEAANAGFTLIDAGHYATEAPAMQALAENLKQLLPEAVINVSKAQSDPAVYLTSATPDPTAPRRPQ